MVLPTLPVTATTRPVMDCRFQAASLCSACYGVVDFQAPAAGPRLHILAADHDSRGTARIGLGGKLSAVEARAGQAPKHVAGMYLTAVGHDAADARSSPWRRRQRGQAQPAADDLVQMFDASNRA